jgi:hypothetical protein
VDEARAADIVERIRALEARVAFERSVSRRLRGDLEAARLSQHDAEWAADQHRDRMSEMRRELDGVYGSRSWRVTRPMRWIFSVAGASGDRVHEHAPPAGDPEMDQGRAKAQSLELAIREAAGDPSSKAPALD